MCFYLFYTLHESLSWRSKSEIRTKYFFIYRFFNVLYKASYRLHPVKSFVTMPANSRIYQSNLIKPPLIPQKEKNVFLPMDSLTKEFSRNKELFSLLRGTFSLFINVWAYRNSLKNRFEEHLPTIQLINRWREKRKIHGRK